MKKKTRQRQNRLFCLLLLLLFSLSGCAGGVQSPAEGSPSSAAPAQTADDITELQKPDQQPQQSSQTRSAVTALRAERLSVQQIQLSWSDDFDSETKEYVVKRRHAVNGTGVGDWTVVATIPSDRQTDGQAVYTTDTLPDETICQLEYTVVPLQEGETDSQTLAGTTVLASNLLVCIDPGHYGGANLVHAPDSYGYAEGDATLRIAQSLQTLLKEQYGIDSCLTREGNTITLDGYSDETLDHAHLMLRGTYAGIVESNLFISLHTNANEDGANGYETCEQPIGINKPILVANQLASRSGVCIAVGNAIGQNLAKVSFDAGLSTVSTFIGAHPGQLEEWSDDYNDSLDVPGKLFCRMKSNGTEDYYGVLRGAAEAGVPGLIIEHGMHPVPQVRQAAMEGDLLQKWAQADAHGIAYGFGFVTEPLN